MDENELYLARFARSDHMVMNYVLGRKLHSGTFKIKGSRAGLVRVPGFVLKVPLCNLRHSIINFVPCDRRVQRAYCGLTSSIDKQGLS